jgi:hypothetical protein
LLAQKVLQGKTKGYQHHSQLKRFQAHSRPAAALATYLTAIFEEAQLRRYHFDGTKILKSCIHGAIDETDGQLMYEWRHLKRKLRNRDYSKYRSIKSITIPDPHPLFRIIPGNVKIWEKVK